MAAAAAAATALGLGLGASAPTLAAGAHQHGVAQLEVVADGNLLTVTLDSPLDNLLAFERSPRTPAERSAVQAMARQLRNPATLPQPSPAAGCTLRSVALASGVIAPPLLAPPVRTAQPADAPPQAGTQAGVAADGHADLEATWQFDCRAPQALQGLAMGGLFQAFPKLRQLDAAVVAPGRQRGARATPKNPALAW